MRKMIATWLGICMMFICSITVTAKTLTSDNMPENLPQKYHSMQYSVLADGQEVGVYNVGNNAWGQEVSNCQLISDKSVKLTIDTAFNFSEFTVLPRTANASYTQNGRSIELILQSPQNITLIFDNSFQGKALHIFLQKPETEIPEETDSDVLYFGPGYYDYSGQSPLKIESGKTLYLAEGAVLRGRVAVLSASDVTICGQGILLNDFTSNDEYDSVALAIKNSSNVKIKDITVLRCEKSWSAFMWKSDNVSVENVKIINPQYASSDGFDIANSHDVIFDNMFIRSCDDSIAIKGTGNNGYNPAEDPAQSPANYNITIQNTQVWSDANNALGIGAETDAAYYDNITFKNIDVLYNYDDYSYPDQLMERSALNICALNATNISNVTYEDIRIEKAKRLISITMPDSFWFGSLQGNWNWNGKISGITYRNIVSYSDGNNEIQMLGRGTEHMISGVTFDNVVIKGQKLGLSSRLLKINKYTKNVQNIVNGSLTEIQDGPFGSNVHKIAEEYSQSQQGINEWYYRTWTNGVGNADMNWNSDGSGHWRGVHSYDAIWMYDGILYLHPDTNQTMLEWKASQKGNIQITGNVRKYDILGGDGVVVSIWKNDTLIWPESGWTAIGYNDNVGLKHDIEVDVEQGDIISFRVDEGMNNAYDTTIWTPVITYNFYREY